MEIRPRCAESPFRDYCDSRTSDGRCWRKALTDTELITCTRIEIIGQALRITGCKLLDQRDLRCCLQLRDYPESPGGGSIRLPV
jgi:hypothetical protein